MRRGEVDVVVHGEFRLARDVEVCIGENRNVCSSRESLRLFSLRSKKTFSSGVVGMKYLVIAPSCRLCVCYLDTSIVCRCRDGYVIVP
jgi:hypothetical protein